MNLDGRINPPEPDMLCTAHRASWCPICWTGIDVGVDIEADDDA